MGPTNVSAFPPSDNALAVVYPARAVLDVEHGHVLVQLVVAFAIVCSRVFPADGNHLLILGVVPVGGCAHKLSCASRGVDATR